MRSIESGYVREAGEAPNAIGVRWWLFVNDSSGFMFARGGRVATARQARNELDTARYWLSHEQEAWDSRRTHELQPGYVLRRRFTHSLEADGSLKSLTPTDFEVE